MPHSIFFYYGFAIHGTTELAAGGPASHGCVRLHPSHAAALFALVERNGPRYTGSKSTQRRDRASTHISLQFDICRLDHGMPSVDLVPHVF